jgi:hypothetical protein
MYGTIECLTIVWLSEFLSLLPPDAWSFIAQPVSFEVYTEQYGTVTWLYNPITELYCHNGGE